MSKLNELAVINPQEVKIIPTQDELTEMREDMADMDRLPYGRIQIAAGGAGVFKVTEPGEDDSSPATEVTGLIIFSHRANGLWMGDFGKSEDKAPVCSSVDGVEGHNTETGEILLCESCPYNQYGSSSKGRGKACKNMRRLYVMRPGDVFPLILALPPTALGAYDKYRTKIMLGRKKMHGVVTKITLKNMQNKDGIAYSTPVFEPVAVLPPAEAERARQYADSFSGAAQNAGITSDDYLAADAAGAPSVDSEFTEIGDEELPYMDMGN